MPDRPTGLGLGDVLSLGEAAAALRMREAVAVRWLREHDLVRTVAGRELVVWADVLAEIRRGGEPAEPPPASRRRATLARVPLP